MQETGVKLVGKSSIKAALDIDWSEPTEKYSAINTVLSDVDRLKQWLDIQPDNIKEHKELKEKSIIVRNGDGAEYRTRSKWWQLY